MNRRKNTGHWRTTLFAGPDNARNEAILDEGQRYYRQFYYPLVLVSPLQDGDTQAWLWVLTTLTTLGHLDTGFLIFFSERIYRESQRTISG